MRKYMALALLVLAILPVRAAAPSLAWARGCGAFGMSQYWVYCYQSSTQRFYRAAVAQGGQYILRADASAANTTWQDGTLTFSNIPATYRNAPATIAVSLKPGADRYSGLTIVVKRNDTMLATYKGQSSGYVLYEVK